MDVLNFLLDHKKNKLDKELSISKKCSVSGTLMVKEKGKVYNRLVWITKNGDIYTYDKYHLFSLTKEGKYLEKGSRID